MNINQIARINRGTYLVISALSAIGIFVNFPAAASSCALKPKLIGKADFPGYPGDTGVVFIKGKPEEFYVFWDVLAGPHPSWSSSVAQLHKLTFTGKMSDTSRYGFGIKVKILPMNERITRRLSDTAGHWDSSSLMETVIKDHGKDIKIAQKNMLPYRVRVYEEFTSPRISTKILIRHGKCNDTKY